MLQMFPYIADILLHNHLCSHLSQVPWAGARKRNKVWLLPMECMVYQREMMLEVRAEHI